MSADPMDCAARPGQPCERKGRGGFLDRSGMVGSIEVRQCIHCGHAVTLPPLGDVAFLYGNRASQDFQPDIGNALSRFIKDVAFGRDARKLLRQIGKPGHRALDFGCGSGQFTRVLGEAMRGTELTGSDFFDAPPAELAGLRYLPNRELARLARSFDLVLALHVLEHDDDPSALLDRIMAPLKHGGTLVIEVPDVGCVWNKVFGRFWDGWYVPYHRHHFTRASLLRLMQAKGLEIVSVHSLTAPAMGRSVANLFGRRNNLFWLLVGMALHPVQIAGEILSGTGTAIRVIARKS